MPFSPLLLLLSNPSEVKSENWRGEEEKDDKEEEEDGRGGGREDR